MASDTETKLFLPCGCAGNCNILAVDRFSFGDEDDPQWYFEVYTRVGPAARFRYRLGKALKVLFNRDHYLDALIYSDEEIQALRDFIDVKLAQPEVESDLADGFA